jgi:hypothetical protein
VEDGLGAILTQIDENRKFHTIGYASKQLFQHEKKHSPLTLKWALWYGPWNTPRNISEGVI